MAIDREKVLQAATKFAEKKRYDKAIAELQRIIQEDPKDTRTLLKIGDYQVKMEAYPAAIETYERVGGLYVQQGFAVKAVAVYKQVRDIIARHFPQGEERYGHILPRLAELHQQMGMKSDAINAYDEYAARLIKGGREKEALGVFKKIVEIDPKNPLAHLRLAEAQARIKDIDGAIAQFSLAANLLIELGRRDDALKVVERLIQIRPDPAFSKVAAQILLARGQPNDGRLALARLQVAFQANSEDPETLRLLANAFDAIDQHPKAIEVLKELARLARRLGDQATLDETTQYLMEVAGGDPEVRALRRGGPSVAPPPREASVVSVASSDISLEEIESLEAQAVDEAPFELKQSRSYRPGPGAPSGVIVSASIEAAEDFQEPASSGVSPELFAAQAIADSTAFRQARLPHKAVEVLRIAIEVVPASADMRIALRDALLEAGDTEGAVGEMITLAAILIEQGDTGAAALELQEVLAIIPGHRRATELLGQLGYGGLEVADDELGYQGAQTAFDAYDPGNPLPTYDLEDVGAIEVLSATGGRPATSPLEETDDPFDLGPPRPRQPSVAVRDALPSFQIDEDNPFDDLPPAPPEVVPEARSQSHAVNANVRDLRAFQGGDSLEEGLEEIDFFFGRGLFDDARSVLNEQLARAPNHPLLLDKLREIDEAEAAADDPLDHAAPSLLLSADGDLGDALDALDDAFEPVQEARPQMQGADDQVDVEAVFAKFKEGVKSQVEEGDSQTHYDLGVAYKEMGLVDDAIGEFRTAGNDPRRTCVCLSMVGVIEMERGRLDQAIAAFHEALGAKHRTVEQELSLLYEIAAIHEAKGEDDRATHFFRKVQQTDPNFRDVAERLAALGASDDPRSRELDDAGDFDAVFDDILGAQTLPGVSGVGSVAKKRLLGRERAGHPALERHGDERRVRPRGLAGPQLVDRARRGPAAGHLVEHLGEARERALPGVSLKGHEQRGPARRRAERARVGLGHARVHRQERAHRERRRRHRAREPARRVAPRARVTDDDHPLEIDARVPSQPDDRTLDQAIEIEAGPQRDGRLGRHHRRRRRDEHGRQHAALDQLGDDDAYVRFVWFASCPVKPDVGRVHAVQEDEQRPRRGRRAARLRGDEEARDVRLGRVAGIARVVDDVDRLAAREDRDLRARVARREPEREEGSGGARAAHASSAPLDAISSAAVERSSIAAARSPERYARRPIAATSASEVLTRAAASSPTRSGCFSSVSRSSSTSNSSFFARAPSSTR